MVPLHEGFSDISKANLYEVITTSLPGGMGAIKRSHEGFTYFLIKY